MNNRCLPMILLGLGSLTAVLKAAQAPSLFEAAFDSLPREFRQRFQKAHPGKAPTRVLAKVTGWKVRHYKIEFADDAAKQANMLMAVKDLDHLEVEWVDSNRDGRIDQQHTRWLFSADRDETLRDTNFDGIFDEHTLFGVGVVTTTVKLTVPHPCSSQ